MAMIPQPAWQFSNPNGKVMAFAKAYFYLKNSTTPVLVYEDAECTIPHPIPVVADDQGLFPAMHALDYALIRVKVVAAEGDPDNPLIDADLDYSGAVVRQNGPEAISRPLTAKVMQEFVSILDYCSPTKTGLQNSAGLNRALAGGRTVHLAGAGGVDFEFGATINVVKGSAIIDPARNGRCRFVHGAGNFPLLNILDFTTLEGFSINGLQNEGATFKHNVSSEDIIETRINDMLVDQSALLYQDSGTFHQRRTYFSNVKAVRHRGPGYVMTRGYAFIWIDQLCLVEYIGSVSPNHTALKYDGAGLGNAAGGLFCGLQTGGTAGVAGTTSDQIGFDIQNASAVYIQGARADTMGGKGMDVNNSNNIHFEAFGAALNYGEQLHIHNSQYIFGVGTIQLRGARENGGPADKAALLINGANRYMHFAGVDTYEATGYGADITDNADGIFLGRHLSINNLKRGLITRGATGVVDVAGGRMRGNVEGNIDLASSHHTVQYVFASDGKGTYQGPTVQ